MSRARDPVEACALLLALALVSACEARLSLGGGCARDSDCAEPLVCGLGGRCRQECITSRDCALGLHCVRDPAAPDPGSALGTCALEESECGTAGRTCPTGLVCLDARCVNDCVVGDDCPDGVCRTGACEPIIAVSVDGGADAARDAPAVDASGPGPDAPDAEALSDAPVPLDTPSLPDAPASDDAGEPDAGEPDAGAGPVPVREAVLLASGGLIGDLFGNAVALSADGTRALVGASSEIRWDRPGSARVFVLSGTSWTEEATLAVPLTLASDSFGCSVALSADASRALVGAFQDDVMSQTDAGSAQVFVRTGTVWAPEAMLFAADGSGGDFFGRSVALSADGTRALVGAPHDGSPMMNAGSARVFLRSGSGWTAEATLVAPDPDAGDELGGAVALSADGTRALVAARRDDTAGGTAAGSVRVFFRSGTSWSHEATLVASDGRMNDSFGMSVALAGDASRALVGAYFDSTPAGTYAGSARAFLRSGTTWIEEATLAPADGAASDYFGISVALSGDGSRALVGAFFDDTAVGADAGSVGLFLRAGGTWAEELTLVSPEAAAGDLFGAAVALTGDGRHALVGTPADYLPGSTSVGVVHVFSLTP